jgi:hypothetical protein
LWLALEKSLARGDNIEEGRFAERSWATLLSDPLTASQVSVLRTYSNEVTELATPGALFHRAIQNKKGKWY